MDDVWHFLCIAVAIPPAWLFLLASWDEQALAPKAQDRISNQQYLFLNNPCELLYQNSEPYLKVDSPVLQPALCQAM